MKLEGLSVRLQGDSILEDVSFHLHCGEIVALIGPNGAGKSSLFRSILGQMPYKGSITFSPAGGPAIRLADGAVTGGKRPLVGYVPQAPSFDRGDPVSVLDFFTAATAKWPVWLPVPKKQRERAAACLARVHGEDLLDKPMSALSGGQLQRVLLALALEPVPHILILDEPLSGVDIEGEHQLLEMLDELRTQYDLSIFLSTHDFATLGQFADKVILLNKKVLKAGPPDEVLSSPEFYETFHLHMGKGGEA
ncbi:metal ABC transporter ATP-binding protein [Pseudoflavonifractor phocaeensis]|nr:metal ABC transporter ATP-binding protein [Pseudoflavonifractor phocaeensis]